MLCGLGVRLKGREKRRRAKVESGEGDGAVAGAVLGIGELRERRTKGKRETRETWELKLPGTFGVIEVSSMWLGGSGLGARRLAHLTW